MQSVVELRSTECTVDDVERQVEILTIIFSPGERRVALIESERSKNVKKLKGDI